jgi:hypothetical protein
MASRRPQATLSSLLTGCLARCRSLIGSDGPIGTPIITCVSSGCEWSPLPYPTLENNGYDRSFV